MMQQLGPGWERSKRPLVLLLLVLLGIVALLWWLETR